MVELNREQIEKIISKNPTIIELANLSEEGLKNRYISKEPISFTKTFTDTVNEKDEKGLRVNYNMHALDGKNLDFIAQQVFKLAKRLERHGYYLDGAQVVRDFEKVLYDFADNIDDDINDNNRRTAAPTLYVTLVTSKMLITLSELKFTVKLNCEQFEKVISKNPTIIELTNLSEEELKNRYISKDPISFTKTFSDTLNEKDEEGLIVNYNVHALNGNNLNFIAQQVFKLAKRLERHGYYLDGAQVVRDFEKVLYDFADNIDDDINDNNRRTANPTFYVTLVTSKMLNILSKLENL